MKIPVTADGHVLVNNNQWASLEQIQQAVLRAQHPTLNTNCPHCKQQIANEEDDEEEQEEEDDDEHFDYRQELAKIDAMPDPPLPPRTKHRKQVTNTKHQEHLPLPTLNFKRLDDKQTTNVSDETDHLPLPSTLRR